MASKKEISFPVPEPEPPVMPARGYRRFYWGRPQNRLEQAASNVANFLIVLVPLVGMADDSTSFAPIAIALAVVLALQYLTFAFLPVLLKDRSVNFGGVVQVAIAAVILIAFVIVGQIVVGGAAGVIISALFVLFMTGLYAWLIRKYYRLPS